jgi:hypothetical protein
MATPLCRMCGERIPEQPPLPPGFVGITPYFCDTNCAGAFGRYMAQAGHGTRTWQRKRDLLMCSEAGD